jgi:hypothetical protein
MPTGLPADAPRAFDHSMPPSGVTGRAAAFDTSPAIC